MLADLPYHRENRILDDEARKNAPGDFILSMGGPIVAAFANRYPETVQRLVLIDPAGFKTLFSERLARAAIYLERSRGEIL